MSLLWFIEPQQ